MPGAFLKIWRQIPGAVLNMEADFGGSFEYGGRFRGQFWIWRRISEAVLNMEADSGGSFEYGGGFRQGSEAQELLKQDMEARLHETLGKEELFDLRSEYYLNFPLSVFRDKIYQEVRTAKYLHTIKERGKLHQAS
jgi:hypothetical protein